MWSEIGEESFRDLMNFILKRQSSYASDLPCLSGHFVDYRGSMINWCPIGRNANQKQREAFVQWDTSLDFRNMEIMVMNNLKLFKDNNSENLTSRNLFFFENKSRLGIFTSLISFLISG